MITLGVVMMSFVVQVHEACMLCLECLVDPLKSCDLQFDCQSFVDGVLLPDVANSCESVF